MSRSHRRVSSIFDVETAKPIPVAPLELELDLDAGSGLHDEDEKTTRDSTHHDDAELASSSASTTGTASVLELPSSPNSLDGSPAASWSPNSSLVAHESIPAVATASPKINVSALASALSWGAFSALFGVRCSIFSALFSCSLSRAGRVRAARVTHEIVRLGAATVGHAAAAAAACDTLAVGRSRHPRWQTKFSFTSAQISRFVASVFGWIREAAAASSANATRVAFARTANPCFITALVHLSRFVWAAACFALARISCAGRGTRWQYGAAFALPTSPQRRSTKIEIRAPAAAVRSDSNI